MYQKANNDPENKGYKSDTVWATRSQIAKRYGVHPGTIDVWRRAGHLPAVIYGTRLVRFDVGACDTWFHQFRCSAKWEDASTKNTQ